MAKNRRGREICRTEYTRVYDCSSKEKYFLCITDRSPFHFASFQFFFLCKNVIVQNFCQRQRRRLCEFLHGRWTGNSLRGLNEATCGWLTKFMCFENRLTLLRLERAGAFEWCRRNNLYLIWTAKMGALIEKESFRHPTVH